MIIGTDLSSSVFLSALDASLILNNNVNVNQCKALKPNKESSVQEI